LKSDLNAATESSKKVNNRQTKTKTNMSDQAYFDEYDQYTFEQEKFTNVGNGGKQRTKREVAINTNRNDTNGHNRKIVTKMANTETNARPRRSSSSASSGTS